jgi:hypothetical protein
MITIIRDNDLNKEALLFNFINGIALRLLGDAHNRVGGLTACRR